MQNGHIAGEKKGDPGVAFASLPKEPARGVLTIYLGIRLAHAESRLLLDKGMFSLQVSF